MSDSNGTAGNDMVRGTRGDDTLRGFAGDDYLLGLAGADVIDGGEGIDTAGYSESTSGVTVDLTGGPGAGDAAGDTFVSIEKFRLSAQADTFIGDDSDSTVFADGGNDSVDGGAGRDRLFGQAGDDLLFGGAGDDSLSGGAGDDVLIGGVGRDTIFGGSGADRFVFSGGPQDADGQDMGAFGSDIVRDFEVGMDVLDFTSLGIEFADIAIETFGSGTLLRVNGMDTIELRGVTAAQLSESDFLFAEGGDDDDGGTDDGDAIVGTPNGDFLRGTAGNDTIRGLGGSDYLLGIGGADVLDGGEGTDTAAYSESRTGVTINLVSGVNTGDAEGDTYISIEQFRLSEQADTFRGGAEDVSVFGFGGADELVGGTGNDRVSGGAGDDLLFGGAGNDILTGGTGGDLLFDGAGDDRFIGGSGADTYVFTSFGGLEQTGRNRISDFEVGVDTLDFSEFDQTSIDNFIVTDTSNGAFIQYGRLIGGEDTIFVTGSVLVENVSAEDLNLTSDQPDEPDDDDAIVGTSANDVLRGTQDDDVLRGLGGDDFIIGRAGADVIYGGEGTDTASYSESDDGVEIDLTGEVAGTSDAAGDTFVSIERFRLSEQQDFFNGDDDANTAYGFGGDDELFGNGGNDTLSGGAGNDGIVGGDGNDLLIGGTGDDFLIDDTGNDRYVGGSGSDTFAFFVPSGIVQNDANRVIDFEVGIDTIALVNSDLISIEDASISGRDSGTLIKYGDSQNSIVIGSVIIENVRLEDFDSSDISVREAGFQQKVFVRPDAEEFIVGTSSDDTLQGTFASDSVQGFDGNDTILGSPGDDILTGGAGRDDFVFRLSEDNGTNFITDFDPSSDVLTLISANPRDFLAISYLSEENPYIEFGAANRDRDIDGDFSFLSGTVIFENTDESFRDNFDINIV